jgi:hypothetical protein
VSAFGERNYAEIFVQRRNFGNVPGSAEFIGFCMEACEPGSATDAPSATDHLLICWAEFFCGDSTEDFQTQIFGTHLLSGAFF